MEQYVRLDVSQKTTAVCVIDQDGKLVWQGSVATTPVAIDEIVRVRAPHAKRIGMETGPLAVWLYHGLHEMGLPIECIHVRHVHAALATQLNKTDCNDARGIAQLTRSDWYRPVEVKSLVSHEIRLLLGARSKLVGMRTAMYNQIRGTLKTFGVVLPAGKGAAFDSLVEAYMPVSSLIQGVIHTLLETWRHLDREIRNLDNAVGRIARASSVCQRLMTVPGRGDHGSGVCCSD